MMNIQEHYNILCPKCEDSSSCRDWNFELSHHYGYCDTPKLNIELSSHDFTEFKCPKCKQFSKRIELTIVGRGDDSMAEQYLYRFYWNCGRQGGLEGLFVSTDEEVAEMIGKTARFGEVLGKHSDISGEIEESDISKVDLDSETVTKVAVVLGTCWSGFDPREYVHYECSRCEDTLSQEELWTIDGNRVCWYCMTEEEQENER